MIGPAASSGPGRTDPGRTAIAGPFRSCLAAGSETRAALGSLTRRNPARTPLIAAQAAQPTWSRITRRCPRLCAGCGTVFVRNAGGAR